MDGLLPLELLFLTSPVQHLAKSSYMNSTTYWEKVIQRGQLIENDVFFALVGSSVSLSANGDIQVVGCSIGYDVHIYRFSSRYDKCLVDEYTPRSSSATVVVFIQLMTVTIQCGSVDAACSLFIH